MNSECDIIMDLAGVYFDKTAAYETNAYVNEHLKHCENCRNFYKQFSQYKSDKKINSGYEIPKWEGNYDEIAYRLKRRKRIMSLIGLAYGISMLSIVAWAIRKANQ